MNKADLAAVTVIIELSCRRRELIKDQQQSEQANGLVALTEALMKEFPNAAAYVKDNGQG
jgi:hypothetical protein